MLLFRDEEHVSRWCTARDLPIGGTMTPEQGWRLAHEWFEDRLKPDWRRHTLDETESVFASIGLTSDFWKLRDA
jgi:carboxypeptidase C (cathepsin A)